MKSLALILIVLLLWAVGLMAFCTRIAHSTPAADPAPADAIVVLTGRSNTRILAGMKLLEADKAPYLLVSGVNQAVTRADILSISRAPRRLYDCCVSLGFNAPNTVGNARETAAWARAHDFHSIIVVTADYHMPRAVLELHGALPGVALTPYPVATDELDARRWYRNGPGVRRMLLEYSKYLVILGREAVLSLGPRERGAPATPVPAPAPPPAAPAGQ